MMQLLPNCRIDKEGGSDEHTLSDRQNDDRHAQTLLCYYTSTTCVRAFSLTSDDLPSPVPPHSKLTKVARTLWRYGLSPIFMERAVSALLSDFDRIYELQDSGAGLWVVPPSPLLAP